MPIPACYIKGKFMPSLHNLLYSKGGVYSNDVGTKPPLESSILSERGNFMPGSLNYDNYRGFLDLDAGQYMA
jgi:hypothetical protein